ncbi:MAG TPA: protein translocase subunit SecD [Nocardioides sp.]|nr:protein translocase subunit SecD [Nocardioides sp.]
MAARRPRPGRTLVIFFLGIAVLYGLVALAGSWKPQLGLDLQGGTRITLTAEGSPSSENLDEARRIIDQRVNGTGVSEVSVTTQGGNHIVVEVPGSTENRKELEDTVKRTAQLRFRLVACSDANPSGPCAASSGTPPLQRSAPFGERLGSDKDKNGKKDKSDAPTASPTDTSSTAPSESPTSDATADPAGDGEEWTTQDSLDWAAAPDQAAIAAFNALSCDNDGNVVDAKGKPGAETKDQAVRAYAVDDPEHALVACEVRGGSVIKYLLSRSVIEGTELTDASAGIPQNELNWVVNIEMGNDPDKALPKGSAGAEDDFEKISKALVGTDRQFAIVLDGKVLSAPTMEATIYDGRSQISGDFTESSATSLATSLKYGALPIAFDKDPTVEEIGPSLAGNQLQAGLTAGAIGLVLVMLYCLLYYRGLGLVVVASLFVAASITYAMVLLLSESAGFTLTLPGIAGLIIAVGITADSFIIFFERIRDEMRDGRSMRVAVESGWHRARVTRMAANTVSILSALVLYIFASGVVKGFGFALGLSTLVDLAVLFWFTKPMVSYLAQFKAFNSGHKLSGLSKETLGMDAPRTARAAGGEA